MGRYMVAAVYVTTENLVQLFVDPKTFNAKTIIGSQFLVQATVCGSG